MLDTNVAQMIKNLLNANLDNAMHDIYAWTEQIEI